MDMALNNIKTYEETDLLQQIAKDLPDLFFIRNKGKNNCYIYNITTYRDATDQQLKNDFNLSVGCIRQKMLSSDKIDAEENGTLTYYLVSKKTFEIHVWSVNKSNAVVLQTAELVRKSVRALENTMNIRGDINLSYKYLDNTTQPMTDCVFSVDLLCKDIWKQTEGDVFNEAYIEDLIPIAK